MAEKQDKYNIFIYGSLLAPEIFKSVSGYAYSLDPEKCDQQTLFAEQALLPRYRKVSPDNVYFYAVAKPSSRIEGYVIYGLPPRALKEVDRYEGNRYDRETVHVNTAHGTVQAQAYLVSHESMKKHFGDRFHVNLIHELWLRKRIEKFIEKRTRPGEKTHEAEVERHADRELLATTERDLVMTHYRRNFLSDFFLEHELDRPRPSIKHLYNDPEARPYIPNYLSLVIKQVLLNQFEGKIQSRYRFELEHMLPSKRYFTRSASLLAALNMVNESRPSVELIIKKCLENMPFDNYDLFDYVKYAVDAADSIFDQRVAMSQLNNIRSNLTPGLVPLGAEIELSNIGAAAVKGKPEKQNQRDRIYEGFKYFRDFCLDILMWKLGGYIDDHSGNTEKSRKVGFLELAPGRLNIAGELSRPATSDPWLLNQLIHGITDFYGVAPHSLHFSFQLRKRQIGTQKLLPLGFVKCLFVLGGGLKLTNSGNLWVSRMNSDEITRYSPGEELIFSRTSKRQWYLGGEEIGDKPPKQATTYIQQYKFIRLDERANYEPLILGLKGLQLAYNPADYVTARQLAQNAKLRRDYAELKRWAVNPTRISPSTITSFLETVQKGLMRERHNKPAHKLHYIDWALSAINVQLRLFNQKLGY